MWEKNLQLVKKRKFMQQNTFIGFILTESYACVLQLFDKLVFSVVPLSYHNTNANKQLTSNDQTSGIK